MSVRLFMRTAVTLQPHGARDARCWRTSVERLARSKTRIRRFAASPPSRPAVVRLSTVTAYGKHCVLPLLPRFFRRYPQIELVMSFHDGGRGTDPAGIRHPHQLGRGKEKDKVSQTLCTMPLILVASPRYLAQRGTPRTLEDLAPTTASMSRCRAAAARTGRSFRAWTAA